MNKNPCTNVRRYYFHRDAMAARNYLNGTKLDDRIIRVDLDPGFEAGRQYGRGTTGGQVRDDRRHEYDEGRGGLPPRHKQRLEKNAIASGTLIAPTSGPLENEPRKHRYEMNMTAMSKKEKEEHEKKLKKEEMERKNKEIKEKKEVKESNDVKAEETKKEKEEVKKEENVPKKEQNVEKKEEVKAEKEVKEVGDESESKMKVDDNEDAVEPPVKKQRTE